MKSPNTWAGCAPQWFLEKARSDVNQEEDNSFANGLKDRALRHINEAINRTRKAIRE